MDLLLKIRMAAIKRGASSKLIVDDKTAKTPWSILFPKIVPELSIIETYFNYSQSKITINS